MKKSIVILLAIISGLIIYFVFFHKEAQAPFFEEIDNSDTKQLNVIASSKQIIQEGYSVDFSFPVTSEEKIDGVISQVVENLISSFEKEAKSFLPHPSGFNREYTLIGNFESKLGNKYDTFVFLMSVDFGGAHPNHFYKTITFDKNQNEINLENFLKTEFNNVNLITKISELAREKIAKKIGENVNYLMLNNGTEPEFNNFKNFYIDNQSIVFLFEPYAVAPYAYSTQEAVINFSELMI
jgi:hypothetical protein